MSLRSKIVLILAVAAVLYAALDVLLLDRMIARPFDVLEEVEARDDVERVRTGLAGMCDDLQLRARTLASGADARRLVEEGAGAGTDPDAAGRLASAGLDLLYLCAPDGTVAWGRIQDPESGASIRLREFPNGALDPFHPILVGRDEEPAAAGLFTTEEGPMLLARAEIPGPTHSSGSVVVGRFFDEVLRGELNRRTGVRVDLWPVDWPALPPRAVDLRDRITSSAEPLVDEVDAETLHLYATLDDLRGRPTLMLRAAFPRPISVSGQRIFRFALLSTVATALLLLLVLLRLLNRIVIRPLATLTRHTVDIGRTEDMSARVEMERGDELGQLSREFDALMAKLAQSREQVIHSSRLAGMSEIATGVLHNVGNVLNSVNVSTSLLRRRAEQLSVSDLQAMTEVLTAHREDLGRFVTEDPRGTQFLGFLEELTGQITSERAEILEELGTLNKGVDHMMELVRSQQSYAGMAGVFEPTDLGEQLDAALRICEQAYCLTEDLRVVREYAEVPRVPVDKHKLMEILVNLIQNAQQVMEAAGTAQKRLILRVMEDGDGWARIEIEDNGPGIAAENLARIFHHGFTTRTDGHGFGLHVSANAATEMKAKLWAESQGPGHGATFILRIPLDASAPALAA